jgi:LuxR family maltose regulon positive regulatory protein
MSELLRERDDLSGAWQHLVASRELGESLGLPQHPYRWRVAMARLRQAEGDVAAAIPLLDEAERVYVGDYSPEVRPVPAWRARVWLAQGEWRNALAWAQDRGVTVDDDLSYLREFEHVTLARAMLARDAAVGSGRPSDEAIGLLERLLQAAGDGGRAGSAIEILVLLALARQFRREPGGLSMLERALTMAEPEGHVRVFVDEGPPMTAMLKMAAKQGISASYVRRLLAAVDKTEVGSRHPSRSSASWNGLIEPLSERELDVLRLLASDLGGPDIARHLVVSLNTVRTHTKSIYTKLGVNTRRAAVRRAEELDLLSRGHNRKS